ncbi:sensor histidine kinase [Phenylobacterium sp.]|uniref:sensor histidine kinase n=1 Tax=Phenylobacterium sp. TaxID=1871053 RepID=UPI003523B235
MASSTSPLLLLDGDLMVIAASASFCRQFQIDPADAPGLQIFALGVGEWNIPQLRSLLNATVSGDVAIEAYEMDFKDARSTRRLVLHAQKLNYGDPDHIRLLLTVTDVTEARVSAKLTDDTLKEKDDLLREKAILLREIQHRVANSLQIIASVLLQSARQVQSEETRTHLHDAHNRVMSIAAVQQQLAASSLSEVALAPYLTKLCASLGASMIHDHGQLSIEVVVDDTVTSPDVSVSLGLIVTELVINALKHAFPGRRPGKIMVGYQATASGWTLSVGDNGVGMPTDPASATPGLGTSIVEALARQLEAEVAVVDAKPGTMVSVAHSAA